MLERGRGFFLALILILVGSLYLASLTPELGRTVDDGRYVVLAQALASGAGYRRINAPEQPPERRLPPGYPALLAPIWWLPLGWSARVLSFKLVTVVSALGAGITGYHYLRRFGYASERAALLMVGLLLLNPLVILYSREALSEMSYILASFLCLWSLERYASQEGARSVLNGWLPLSVLTLALAFYIRNIGLTLGLAATLYLAMQGKARKAVALGAIFLLLILPWGLAMALGVREQANSYLAQFLMRSVERPELGTITPLDLGHRLLQNGQAHLLAGLPGSLLPSLTELTWSNIPAPLRLHPPLLPLSILLSIITLAGLLTGLVFRRRILHLYALFYLVFVLLWPWEPTRLLVPLILPLYVCSYRELAALLGTSRWRGGLSKLAPTLVLVYLLAQGLAGVSFVRGVRSGDYGFAASPLWRATEQTYAWIRENTPRDAILAAMNDAQAYLYTGRLTSQGLHSAEALVEEGVGYVVLIPFPALEGGEDLSRARFEPLRARYPGAFSSLYSTLGGDIEVLRVDKSRLQGVSRE